MVLVLRRHLKQERGTEFQRQNSRFGKGAVRKISHCEVRYMKKDTKEVAF